MKHLLLPIAALLIISTPRTVQAAIDISFAPTIVTPGSTFDIPLLISGASDVYAFQADISFDPGILQLLSIDEGDFLRAGGSTFFIPGSIDNTVGSATFTANTLFGLVPGVNGSGSLALFGFQATALGGSPLALSNVTLLDSNLNAIPFTTQNGQVSSVPEPGTLLLLTSAAVGLFAFNRRRIRDRRETIG